MGYNLKTEETITCSKSAIKMLEICLRGVRYVQNYQERHKNDFNDTVLVSLL